MKSSDIYLIIKNKFKNKDNIIFIIVNVLTILSILICLTLINLSFDFRNDNYETLETRTLIVSKLDDNEKNALIYDIDHIDFVDSDKYRLASYTDLLDFQDDKLSTELSLKPLLINDLKISYGENIDSDNELLCPEKFYPYSLYVVGKYDTMYQEFHDEKIIDAKSLIGKDLRVVNYNNEETTLKIVGTYKNKTLEGLNTCFISKKGFDNYKSKYQSCSNDECYEYNSLMVILDDYKNMEYVENELKRLGFSSIRAVSFDNAMLDSLVAIPAYIGSIILIISILVICAYIKKKSNNEMRSQSILKSLGYKEKEIININRFELFISYLISVSISLIIYFILFIIIHYLYLDEFRYYSYLVPIPIVYIFVFLVLLFFYIIFVCDEFTKRNYKLGVQKLFEE